MYNIYCVYMCRSIAWYLCVYAVLFIICMYHSITSWLHAVHYDSILTGYWLCLLIDINTSIIIARCLACHYHTKIHTIFTPPADSYFPYRNLRLWCGVLLHDIRRWQFGTEKNIMFTAPVKYQMVRRTAGGLSTGGPVCFNTVLPKSTNFSFQSKKHSRDEIKVCSNNF